ncbi:MAG TPA: glutamyl-tRNA reductase, partial [Methanocorpusculum sp.]|nr:glutamyl-tRNA reductase [Methanocorpusculum sp.]
IETAIQLGVRIRQQTSINRGAVSIGSAAVQLAENICGSLSGKNILVVGGGEMGKLVTKALSEKNLRAIYVTNRTYENALKLAEEVNGRAMHMDQLYTCIGLSDVVISCTSAPHEIIRADPLREIMETRLWPLDDGPRPLILIDIANPPDVERACTEIFGVKYFTIDDLADISEQNMSIRRDECSHAEEIITKFQPEFIRTVRRTAGHNVLAELYSWAEEIRSREAEHALQALEHGKSPKEVIPRLTKSLTKKLMDDASAGIRRAAEEQSLDEAEKIVRIITRGQ